MKPNLLTFLFIVSVVTFSTAQVGVGTPLPNASAQMDIVASDKGVLIPRLNIADLNTAAPVSEADIQTSLLAYNTNSVSGTGYHYWNGSRWMRLATSTDMATGPTASLSENGDGTYTYTHQDGTITVIDFPSAETSTDLVDNGDGTLTYTNEENVEQTIDILATVAADIQNQGDIYDEIINVVNANSDELLDNGDGTFAHTSADGTTLNFDVTQKATGNPNTNGTIGAAGNVYVDESTGDMYTHNGTAWEPVGVTAADLTDDAWINNPTDGVIELGTKSDGTARDPLTEVLISDTGRIAIGRSTPGVAFEIVSETPGANGMTVRSFNNTTNPGAFLTHWTARGTSTSPLAVVDGDNIGRYVGTSYDGTTFRNAASIQLEVDGTPSAATGVPGAVVFNTTNSTAQPAERMRVASDGNVGIGTNTPNERLEVNGKVRISDLTGTDTATDVIVTADAVTGVLKDGGTLAEVAAATEPWFGAGPDAALGTTDDIGATLNTEDIYSLGNVTIGDNSPNNGIPLRVRDPGTVPDPYGSGIARPPAAMEFNFSGATLSRNQYTITGAPQGYGILKQHNLDAAFTTRIYTGEDNVIRNTTSNTTNILGNRLLLKDLAGGNLSTYVGNVTRVDKHGGAVANLTGEIISARLFAGATATNRITGLSVSTDIRAGATAPVATGISVDDVTGATENYAIRTGLGNVSFGDTVFATRLDDSNPLATDVLVTANAATGELKDGGTIAEIAALADLRLVGTGNHITSDAGTGSNGTNAGTGRDNVLIGENAGANIDDDNENIMIGEDAGNALNQGNSNVFIGNNSGANANPTASIINGAVAIGNNAGQNIGRGTTVFIGNDAGSLSTGDQLVMVGSRAGTSTTTGRLLTFVGNAAGRSNDTGSQNTFIGDQAGVQNVAGSRNTALGASAGNLSTEDDNVFIGNRAGDNLTAGSDNIIIGSNVDAPTTAESNQINIGNTIYARNTNNTATSHIGLGLNNTDADRAKVQIRNNRLGIGETVDEMADFTLVLGGNGVGGTFYLPERSAGFAWANSGTGVGRSATNLQYYSPYLHEFYNAGDTAPVVTINGDNGDLTVTNINTNTGDTNTDKIVVADANGVLKTVASTNLGTLADLRLVGDANHITIDAGVGSDGTGVGTGARNVAIGPDALSSNTTGFDNIAIGFNSLSSVTEASNNIALGWSALSSYVSGTLNIAIGNSSLRYHVTGDQNIAMGFASLQNHVDGTDNISIGTKSLRNLLDGNDNVVIGVDTGDNLTTGSRNIIIGDGLDFPDATGSNQLNIGNIIYGTNIDGVTSTVSTGNIGIGVVDPDEKLEVNGNAMVDGISISGSVGSRAVSIGKAVDTHRSYETAFGINAASGNVGDGATAVGNNAAFNNIGSRLTAVGFQAAGGNTGSSTTAIGWAAASGNMPPNVTVVGSASGGSNTGQDLTVIGANSGARNSGLGATIIGALAGNGNSGGFLSAVGFQSGAANAGNHVSAIGFRAARLNTGNSVVAIGPNAAQDNVADNVVAIGANAGNYNALAGQTIFSNSTLPRYADRATALAVINIANGAVSGNTYLYYNASNFTVEAVRL